MEAGVFSAHKSYRHHLLLKNLFHKTSPCQHISEWLELSVHLGSRPADTQWRLSARINCLSVHSAKPSLWHTRPYYVVVFASLGRRRRQQKSNSTAHNVWLPGQGSATKWMPVCILFVGLYAINWVSVGQNHGLSPSLFVVSYSPRLAQNVPYEFDCLFESSLLLPSLIIFDLRWDFFVGSGEVSCKYYEIRKMK